jgi:hypothetical protein
VWQAAALVEGWYEDGLLGVAAASLSGGKEIGVFVADKYGLGSHDRWNNHSGSILGTGVGSKAVFSRTEEYIGDEVSSCLNDAGFIAFSVFCSSHKVKPLACVGYSPGARQRVSRAPARTCLRSTATRVPSGESVARPRDQLLADAEAGGAAGHPARRR